MLYTLANKIWHVVKWIWLTIFIAFFLGLGTNLMVAKTAELPQLVLISILNWFTLLGLPQIVLLTAIGLFLLLSCLSFIFVQIDAHTKDGKVLRQYLHFVQGENSGLSITGIYQQQALASVNVPLDDNFIHSDTLSPLEGDELLSHSKGLACPQRDLLCEQWLIRWLAQTTSIR